MSRRLPRFSISSTSISSVGEGLADLGLLVPIGDAVEVLDGLDLAGCGALGE